MLRKHPKTTLEAGLEEERIVDEGLLRRTCPSLSGSPILTSVEGRSFHSRLKKVAEFSALSIAMFAAAITAAYSLQHRE